MSELGERLPSDRPSSRRKLPWPGLILGAIAAAGLGLAGELAFGLSGDATQLSLSLWALLALGLVPAAALFVWLFWGVGQLAWTELMLSALRRYRLVLLGPILLLAWWALTALSLTVFQAGGGVKSQALILALGSAGLLGLGSFVLERVSAFLARRLPAPSLLAASSSLILSLGLGMSLMILGGQTSGVGGAFGPFGVFRRPELILWPLGLLLAAFSLAISGALVFPRRLRWVWTVLGLVLLGLTAGLGLVSARPGELLAIERTGGTSRMMLALVSRLADRDHDGSPGWPLRLDCDDHDPRRYPGAIDRPDNGRDEDCSGSDAKRPKRGDSPASSREASSSVSLPERSWDLVLLTVDTMRAELSSSGGRPGLTPQLDQLAARAILFENAYSLASYTSKSLGPALLGRYSSECSRSFEHFDRFGPELPFVQERLQKGSYHTVSVQGFFYFFMPYGFERGFDLLDKSAAPKQIVLEGDQVSNGDKVATQTIAQLQTLWQTDKPAYVWTHFIDPHAEYVAHADHDFGSSSRERYDGEIAFVDAQLGRIVQAIAEGPRADRTIIVVTSDHGEAFGEHGMIRHGFELWEELVRVPLLIYVPGARAHHVKTRRSAIDLVPTILHVLGMPENLRDGLPGESLVPDLLSPSGQEPPQRDILIDMPKGPNNKERRAFIQGSHKLVLSEGQVLGLYDLDSDPQEKRDLSKETQLTETLKAAYQAKLAELELRPAR